MSTPSQHSDHGSVTVNASPSVIPSKHQVTATPSESALLARLVEALRPRETIDVYLECFNDHELDQLIELADNMPYRIDESLPPASKAQMLHVLADFADFLQVSVPGDAGIALYLSALEDVPFQFLTVASERLAKQHRFARLPLPADFRKHIEPEIAGVEALKHAWATTVSRLNQTKHRRKQRG